MADTAPGAAQYQQLVAGGFSAQEANQWQQSETTKLRTGGFNEQEIATYWGQNKPDTTAIDAHLAANHAAEATADPKAAIARTPAEALAAGWDRSVTGLAAAGHNPNTVLPEHAGLLSSVLSDVGQAAGDIPATGLRRGARNCCRRGGWCPCSRCWRDRRERGYRWAHRGRLRSRGHARGDAAEPHGILRTEPARDS